jgi:dipeptidyl aminopeptidase/acylaminoacyl peptidase
LRHADGRVTPDGAATVCVRERHDSDGVTNELVSVPVDGSGVDGEIPVLFSGPDFVSTPRVSPDGRHLAWLSWDHPLMPWDGTRLWLADVAGTGTGLRLGNPSVVAGSDTESLVQPEWGPDGTLYVVSDRTDWWNVYRVDLAGSGPATLVPVYPVAAEVAEPAWVFGLSQYAVGPDAVWLSYSQDGAARLVRVPTDGTAQGPVAGAAKVHTLDAAWLIAVRADATEPRLVGVAGYLDREPQVVEFGLDPAQPRVLLAARDLALPAAVLSRPRHVTFPSAGGRVAHAWYYPPVGTDGGEPLAGLDGELPPLIVHVHGGPTAAADPAFNLREQFWTSRGFAVIDVDYGGSSGYGRAYRKLLDLAWGVVDIEDCSAAALWAAGEGLADPRRLAISGGSAGGYTVLSSLATTDTFGAGASHYGIADLRALAQDTHKLESRYLDGLVGPLPEAEAVYRERSALAHIDGFSAPLIVFQGLEDAVVPPAQAEAIVAALAAKGVPHAYLPFEGEQHGFRIAKNILRAVTAELSFYGQVFGFTPAGDIEPVQLVQ